MPLDTTETNPAYVCGRLIAVLESLESEVLPEDALTVGAKMLPPVVQNPALAVTLLGRWSPSWLGKLARRDPAAATHYQNRITDVVALLPADLPGADLTSQEHQYSASIGYMHQRHVDNAAGHGPGSLITTATVAEILGYSGNSAVKTAATWLHRKGIRPTGRQPGRAGQNTYNAYEVLAAKDAAPGRGARTDLRAVDDRSATA